MRSDDRRIQEALKEVKFFDSCNLIDRAHIEVMHASNGACRIICDIRDHYDTDLSFLELRIKQCLLERCGIKDVQLVISSSLDAASQKDRPAASVNLSGLFTPIQNVQNVIVICSGKGGVGKSTMTVCLAKALSAAGHKVGIADLDIYGPSIPALMQIKDKIKIAGSMVDPIVKDGIAVMSLALMIGADVPAIWRGPMVSKATIQILRQTAWPELDFLLLDTPPGTGDVHLSLLQRVPIDSAILVSTAHHLALQNSLKTLRMLQKYAVSTMGLLRNMLYTSFDAQEGKIYPWGNGDLQQYGVATIADIPMVYDMIEDIMLQGDNLKHFSSVVARLHEYNIKH